jgi:hypothetical protein
MRITLGSDHRAGVATAAEHLPSEEGSSNEKIIHGIIC